MEIPTLREKTCIRKVAFFRSMAAKRNLLTTEERNNLLEEMQIFADSLSTGTVIVGSAGLGLAAAVLPVIGAITGPLVGGFYGAYKAYKLSHYRDEVLRMIREMTI